MSRQEFVNELEAYCAKNNLQRVPLIINISNSVCGMVIKGNDAINLFMKFLTDFCSTNNLQFTTPKLDEEMGVYSYIKGLTN